MAIVTIGPLLKFHDKKSQRKEARITSRPHSIQMWPKYWQKGYLLLFEWLLEISEDFRTSFIEAFVQWKIPKIGWFLLHFSNIFLSHTIHLNRSTFERKLWLSVQRYTHFLFFLFAILWTVQWQKMFFCTNKISKKLHILSLLLTWMSDALINHLTKVQLWHISRGKKVSIGILLNRRIIVLLT